MLYSNDDKVYIYLDLEGKYYSYNTNELIVPEYKYDKPEEEVIGPKAMVVWNND